VGHGRGCEWRVFSVLSFGLLGSFGEVCWTLGRFLRFLAVGVGSFWLLLLFLWHACSRILADVGWFIALGASICAIADFGG